ncbi:UBX domain-containing protein 11 isoform X2 [Denticeps clupeoides]|uniref:UBX domain-containing protein 11 isoform X2 n=1 Tax=Denticeps clupeoides TaxID=299321 RepID=UPI0010A59876|nr:UBX domain-containing protein 11 isoform X2 [Denticeps clupeoides]
MSSPLSQLGKNRRAPLPGTPSARMVGGAFKQTSDSDQELSALLRSSCTRRSRPTPASSAASESMCRQRKQNPAQSTPPSDFELMAAMMQKLAHLETKVKAQALDIARKDRRIAFMEEKLKPLPVSEEDREEELVRKCHKLQRQVYEMEQFLSDYGMIWVGSSEDSSLVNGEDTGQGGLSQVSVRSITPPGGPEKFSMDFDLVLQNIQDLNVLAGEGESYVRSVPGGAELARRSPVPLWLYRNGIVMFNGPFRSYEDSNTQQCMLDLMDGYFPSELQERFPEGVPIQVHDRREEVCTWAEFPVRGGLALTRKPQASTATVQWRGPNQGHRLSTERFLNKLPKMIVKAGRVIEIRDSIRAQLQGSSNEANNHAVTIIDTTDQSQERLGQSKTVRTDSVTTLRVKSEDGVQTFVLKMYFTDTIGRLRQHLDTQRQPGAAPYELMSAFPRRRHGDDSQTLSACGLTPNAVLLLHPLHTKH